MVLHLHEKSRIENPREYPPRVVADLRTLLRQGVQARPDPRRGNFYEIESNQSTFFIHISPVSGNVTLLARWSRQSKASALKPTHEAA